MGKKKHKKHGKHDHRAEPLFGIPPHVAGIAAVAIEQVNSPAFRQMIAGALGAAAQAFDRRSPKAAEAPVSPVPPVPPVPPAPPCPPGGATLTPDAEQAIERVAAQAGKAMETAATIAARALESANEAMTRWAAQQRVRTAHDDTEASSHE